MSVGFFAVLSPRGLDEGRVDSAFVAHTPWGRDGGDSEVDLQGANWRLICLKDTSGASKFWREKERSDFLGSFVQVLGWCYKISSKRESLNADDYRQILERFRAGKSPLDGDYGGNFVLLAYDSKTQRLAVQPDRLAMGTAFYSEENGEFACSNRALRLASYFRYALDGHSVLAQMRGTHMPFGRSFFSGVRRLMSCEYIEIDLARGRAEVKKPDSLFVPTRAISYGDSVDLVAETVQTTVSRLLAAGPVQFDLTGGNDTRVLASAIDSLTRNNGTHQFSFRVADPEGSPDVRVARRISEDRGWSLTRVDRHPLPEPGVNDLASAATGSDGNFPAHYIWERVSFERLHARHGQWNTHVGAASGELFRGFFYTHEMFSLGSASDVNYGTLLAYRTYASRGVNLR